MALLNTKAPRLPTPSVGYDRMYQDQLLNVLRLYFNQLDTFTASAVNGGPFTYIDFDKAAPFTNQEARIGWNSMDETLNLGMAFGVVQQVGMETYARVENATGVTIPNGTVVGFVGVGPGDVLSVAPYLADGSQPSLYVLGVLTHDLPDSGDVGYCTVWGHVRDLDTTGTPVGETWSVGDILYANPAVAGAFTNVKPTAPDNVIPVAAVLTVHATTGGIFVRPTVEQMKYYGVFAKTGSQSPAAVNTEYLLAFDALQVGNGVVIGTPASRIVVPVSGLFQFTVTVQLTSSSASQKSAWVWFKRNGVVVPNSARLTTIALNGGYTSVALSEFFSLAANDYVEIAFAADDTNISLASVAATAFAPVAPAALLSVTQVQQ